jgi:hypothetical protein
MATVITATDVVSMFGAYYLNAGQDQNNIHDRLREQFGSQDAFTVIETEDTILRESNTAYAEVLQGFQKAFTPKGGVTFTPKQIPLFNVKVDQSFYPDDLKNSWFGFLLSEKLDRTEWPFVRWFIEVYVMGQIMADLETQAIYAGVYAAPTPGTANAAVAVMNGVKKIINDAITATTMTTLATGAPSATNTTWATQVEDFCKLIPELYWNQDFALNMSRGLALRYKQGRRTKYNSNYSQASDMLAVQDFENIQVTGRASMTGATKIWGTPKKNAILAFKGGSNKQIVEVEKVDRQVKVYTDFWIGAGFIDDGIVFTNDRDLV